MEGAAYDHALTALGHMRAAFQQLDEHDLIAAATEFYVASSALTLARCACLDAPVVIPFGS